MQDIPAIAEVAHRRGALVITDNSWATPFGFRSFDHGVDVSVHAATKYIGGHSDVLLGLILGNEATFPALHRIWTDMGVTASSDDCFLGVARPAHAAGAPRAARGERARDRAVAAGTARGARGDLSGAAGIARPRALEARFHRRDRACSPSCCSRSRRRASTRCSDGMQLFGMGWSWGGFESLIIPTYPELAQTATKWDAGGPCLRLAIGLEDPADLIADLTQGFARLAG